MMRFPSNFLWGAATSSYQVEGNNINSDWWEWEKRVGLKDVSGCASRHYGLFRQDFDLAKSLNHNAHRLSIEWSRLEPQEGSFSRQELQHYLEVIAALKERGIEPVATLNHFTLPLWFAKKGGWLNKNATLYFLRYIQKIVSALAPQVRYWITINEPLVYLYYSYILGAWPPQEKSLFKAKTVWDQLTRAHIEAYQLIHDIYRKDYLAPCSISIAQNLQAFKACRPCLLNRICAQLRHRLYNLAMLETLIRAKTLDFIGINYYGPSLVEVRGILPMNLFGDTCNQGHSKLAKNSMGWDIYPQGLYDLLIALKKYNLPVMITENGICTDDDSQRWEFIRQHLEKVYQAIQDGVKVSGYLYWSLLDNFEWDKGFGERFGLIEVDYRTFSRRVRESAWKLAEVCRTGILEDGTDE